MNKNHWRDFMKNRYYNIEEVSKELHLAKPTVYAYVNRKKIPHIKLGGKLLFQKDEITAWLDSMKHPAIQEKGA
jgi:excisionase family DNA binding protein